jgi:hypothetical protein
VLLPVIIVWSRVFVLEEELLQDALDGRTVLAGTYAQVSQIYANHLGLDASAVEYETDGAIIFGGDAANDCNDIACQGRIPFLSMCTRAVLVINCILQYYVSYVN